MQPTASIGKRQADPDGLDFEQLREAGLALVQALSGDVWTDYNLHDPGVTILEQLCYGLSDLAYRSGFSAQDFLAREDGAIDYAALALHRPDAVFSCGPVTENDYRKLILTEVPNVDNVWLEASPAGIYRVILQLSERVAGQENDRVRKVYADQVRKVYAKHRNLCEDLAEVIIADRVRYTLRGRIEISGARPPVDILAEIYAECANYLCPKVAIRPYAEAHDDGTPLDELFTGPLTAYGHIADADLLPWRGHYSAPELLVRINRIKGVKRVEEFAFVDAAGEVGDYIVLDPAYPRQTVVALELPIDAGEDGIRLHRFGEIFPVAAAELRAGFERLRHRQHRTLLQQRAADWVAEQLPRGVYRSVHEYSSIQAHFPATYGVNAHGVPDSESPQRKAQAKQLKAYLLFFEQIMANFLANIQALPRLYSPHGPLAATYAWRTLGNAEVPGAEAVYQNAGGMNETLAALVAGVEARFDRRNRVLDYLLALYGEQFGQNALLQLATPSSGIETQRIENKVAFLKAIVELGAHRATALNYQAAEPSADNVAGLTKKLCILLGLAAHEDTPWIVEHILTRTAAGPAWLDSGFYGLQFSVIFPAGPKRYGEAGFRRLAENTVRLNAPAHLCAQVRWLDEARTAAFTELHASWLAAKRAPASLAGDAVTAKMAAFLGALR